MWTPRPSKVIYTPTVCLQAVLLHLKGHSAPRNGRFRRGERRPEHQRRQRHRREQGGAVGGAGSRRAGQPRSLRRSPAGRGQAGHPERHRREREPDFNALGQGRRRAGGARGRPPADGRRLFPLVQPCGLSSLRPTAGAAGAGDEGQGHQSPDESKQWNQAGSHEAALTHFSILCRFISPYWM